MLEVKPGLGTRQGFAAEHGGSGAIFEAARIVNQFYETLHNEKY